MYYVSTNLEVCVSAQACNCPVTSGTKLLKFGNKQLILAGGGWNMGRYQFNLGRFDIVWSWTEFDLIRVGDGSTRFNLGRQG